MADKYWISTSSGDWGLAANWNGAALPVNGDNARIPAGTASIATNLTSLNAGAITTFGRFSVEPGYTGTIGTSTTNCQITATSFDFSGTGTAYFDLQASAISPQVHATATAATGLRGLYLIGSALANVNVFSGFVGLAAQPADTSTTTTVSILGTSADVWVGKGCTLTNAYQTAGRAEIRCACTTINCYGGTVYTKELGAVTTINCYGGTVFSESTGTVTTAYPWGGTISFLTCGTARTLTNLHGPDPGGTIIYDPNVLTITNRNAPTYPVRLVASKAS